mgnify:FL=1
MIENSVRREGKALGLTLIDLASRSGVSKSTISEIEYGLVDPMLGTAFQLSIVMDCSLYDIFSYGEN